MKVKEKLHFKKVKKVERLKEKPLGAKQYKKFMLIKRFTEEEDSPG